VWLILIWIDVDTWDVKKKRFYWNFDRNVINLQGLYAILRLGVDKKKIEIPERFIITRWLFQTENKKKITLFLDLLWGNLYTNDEDVTVAMDEKFLIWT
jgi:hypothetical protein